MFDFSTFPTLTTQRLCLRQLVANDAVDTLVFRGDPEVQKYNSEPLKNVAEAATFLQELGQLYQNKQEITWGITRQGEDRLLGMCSLFQWDRFHQRADIGYDLARAEWGQGIGGEAVHAVLRFGFESLKLHRIEADTIIDNHASVRMLQKLGFQLEGVRREYSLEEDGSFHGSGIFGLLKNEYK